MHISELWVGIILGSKGHVHNMLHHLIRMREVVGHENTAVGLHFIANFLVHHNRHNCRLMVAPVLTARLLQMQVAVIH